MYAFSGLASRHGFDRSKLASRWNATSLNMAAKLVHQSHVPAALDSSARALFRLDHRSGVTNQIAALPSHLAQPCIIPSHLT